MPRRAALLAAIAAPLTAPGSAAAQRVDAPPAEPDIGSILAIDRNLPAIADSLSRAGEVFDAQLAQAILGQLRALPARRPSAGSPAADYRLSALPAPATADASVAAIQHGSLGGGPLAVDWTQQFDGPALAGRLGVSHAGGPVEVRFDLQSRVPLAAPLAASFTYDTSAWVRVLPALRLGAVASGPLESLTSRRAGQAVGPEAKLVLPGFGGSLDAEAGWRLPTREGQAGTGGQPGVLSWSLSFHKAL